MVKKTIKYLLAIILYYSGLLTFLSFLRRASSSQRQTAVLMYHRVLEENDDEIRYVQPGMYVTRSVFEKQVEYLIKKFGPISLKKFIEILKKKQSPPAKSVAITFDDGWKDNYLYAYPVLIKNDVPATIFLATDFIDSDNTFWFADINMILSKQKITSKAVSGTLKKVFGNEFVESSFGSLEIGGSGFIDPDKFLEDLKRLESDKIEIITAELKRESGRTSETVMLKGQTLNWKEVLEMNQNGIDFGSHGCSHRILTGLPADEARKELIESKKIIETKLGRGVDLFAYPNGDYNDQIKDLVVECGYSGALTTGGDKGQDSGGDIYSVRRINIHDGVSVGPRGNFSAAMFSLHLYRNT